MIALCACMAVGFGVLAGAAALFAAAAWTGFLLAGLEPESEFARKLRLGECICGGPRADGRHDSTCPRRAP